MVYGDAMTADGRGVPMTVDNNGAVMLERAGIDPTRLDDAIDSLVQLCEGGAKLLDESGPMIEALLRQVQGETQKAMRQLEVMSASQDAMTADDRAKFLPGINDALSMMLNLASRVTVIQERISKTLANAVKAKDTAVRLRTFVATGDEGANGLENMSESALRRLVNATANGDTIPAEQRRG